MKQEDENTNRGLAAAFTLGYHSLLFLLIFFVVFKTKIPAFEDVLGGSGLEVNFGNSETGLGDNTSEELLPVDMQPLNGSNNDNYLTQDNENTPTITASTNPNKTTSVIKINDPVINPNAIYKKKTTSQGIAGGTGNQGKPNGDPNSNNYTGNGGTGGTTGTGTGTGIGPNTGPGISIVLDGRTPSKIPKPKYTSDDYGIIVVAITVDRNGIVTKANAILKGSTNTNLADKKNCEAAALKTTFSIKANAAVEQHGTITYVRLNQN
jgi:hypothetical protein